MDLEKILLAIYQKLCDIEHSLMDLGELGSINMQMMDVVSDVADISKEVSEINLELKYR